MAKKPYEGLKPNPIIVGAVGIFWCARSDSLDGEWFNNIELVALEAVGAGFIVSELVNRWLHYRESKER